MGWGRGVDEPDVAIREVPEVKQWFVEEDTSVRVEEKSLLDAPRTKKNNLFPSRPSSSNPRAAGIFFSAASGQA